MKALVCLVEEKMNDYLTYSNSRDELGIVVFM